VIITVRFCYISVRYKERVVIEPHPAPKKFENFELTGKIYCIKCHWEWGVMGVYKKVPFPFINIAKFVVVNPNNVRNKYKRWKDVVGLFEVNPITPNDLEKMRPAGDEIERPAGDDEEPTSDDSGDEESLFCSTNTD